METTHTPIIRKPIPLDALTLHLATYSAANIINAANDAMAIKISKAERFNNGPYARYLRRIEAIIDRAQSVTHLPGTRKPQ
jgi:hypothetical protein